jgi:hypothetical protein
VATAERRLLAGIDRLIACWGAASWGAISTALADGTVEQWRTQASGRRQLFLFVAGPPSDDKVEVIEFGAGLGVDRVVDATTPTADLAAALTPLTTSKAAP